MDPSPWLRRLHTFTVLSLLALRKKCSPSDIDNALTAPLCPLGPAKGEGGAESEASVVFTVLHCYQTYLLCNSLIKRKDGSENIVVTATGIITATCVVRMEVKKYHILTCPVLLMW